MKRNQRFAFFVILLLGIILRSYKVTEVPPALSWDEASIGYNAYSILTTGRDEHGRFLPLDTFVAFGDYKPPLAIYATVPFVALLGLTELAVRLPSVIAGTLTVLITYFLVLELFSGKSRITNNQSLALMSAFLLAISPWHVQLSRAGFEGNIATFFVVFGVFLILRARKDPRLLAVSLLPFVAAVYTFNSSRYFVPFLSLGLLVHGWKQIRNNKKDLFIGVSVAAIALLPIIPHLFSTQSRLRFQEVNIFTDRSIVDTANERILGEGSSWWARTLHNRRVGYFRSYLIHFFDNLQPWFLFIRGDGNPKFSLQDVGELYIFDVPFLVLGILFMFRHDRRVAWFLSFWLLASILPAATARETPHALRIEQSLPTWQMIVAYGMIAVFTRLIAIKKVVALTLVTVAYAANGTFFLHNYFQHYAREYSGEWQYGYREAVRYAATVKHNYDIIILTESIGRPYIYVLFYEQFNPRSFWVTKDASFDAAGFYNVYGFDRYRFVREGYHAAQGRVLYILPPQDVPKSARILHTVNRINGEPALVIFEQS